MITNGEIRKQVTEQLKHNKLRVFGYNFLYAIITGIITVGINAVLSLITLLLGGALGSVVCVLFKVENTEAISAAFSYPFWLIFTATVMVFMATFEIGLIRELIQMKSNKGVSPVSFFSLGFKDYKRTIKTYIKLYLKFLPAFILLMLAQFCYALTKVVNGNEILAINLNATSTLLYIVGIVTGIIIFLSYQPLPYVLVNDETTQDSGQILVKSRELLRGHFWQWTRMNYFYSFVNYLIMVPIIIVVTYGIYTTLLRGETSTLAILLVAFFTMFVAGVVALLISSISAIIMLYFQGKNIFNLQELYRAIEEERTDDF